MTMPARPAAAAPGRASAAGAGAAGLVRMGRRSGATDAEVRLPLPGDDLIARPRWRSTRATTIAAPRERVWPWIVQMGFPRFRAGWYTPHVLDRVCWGIRERSSDTIREDLQDLRPGDHVPDSADGATWFTVTAVDPPEALVPHSTRHLLPPVRRVDFSWAFVLRDDGPDRTRLLIRARTDYEPWWARPLVDLLVGAGDWLNAAGMLRGIRIRAERAERLSRA